MPDARFFIDTNLLVYARQRKPDLKVARAREWLMALAEANAAQINLQVLNELANAMLRKHPEFSAQEVFDVVDTLSPFGVTPVDRNTALRARALHLRYLFSWWDCILLASALDLGCSHFLSEDLKDGQTIEGLTIVDPFAHSPDRILASR